MNKKVVIAIVAVVIVLIIIIVVVIAVTSGGGNGVPERFSGGFVRVNDPAHPGHMFSTERVDADGPNSLNSSNYSNGTNARRGFGANRVPADFDIIEMGRHAGMDMPTMMIRVNDENNATIANALAKREERRQANVDATGSNTRGRDSNQMETLIGAPERMDNSRGAKEHFVDCPCGCNNYMA